LSRSNTEIFSIDFHLDSIALSLSDSSPCFDATPMNKFPEN
jgi:hypothetical protein